MTPREQFARRRRLFRTLNAAVQLPCGSASRLAFLAAMNEVRELGELRAVCATGGSVCHGLDARFAWTAGMIPRAVAGFDGDNFLRALRDRRLQRVISGRPAYQPGPARGCLP